MISELAKREIVNNKLATTDAMKVLHESIRNCENIVPESADLRNTILTLMYAGKIYARALNEFNRQLLDN